jgi:hypothetical protein
MSQVIPVVNEKNPIDTFGSPRFIFETAIHITFLRTVMIHMVSMPRGMRKKNTLIFLKKKTKKLKEKILGCPATSILAKGWL